MLLNSIVDNIEQHGQQNIVQTYFHNYFHVSHLSMAVTIVLVVQSYTHMYKCSAESRYNIPPFKRDGCLGRKCKLKVDFYSLQFSERAEFCYPLLKYVLSCRTNFIRYG